MLVSSFVIPVSAQEKVYTATFYADGVFGYKEDAENLIICSLTLENAADFSYGEVIFRYNPDVLKGSPENISTPPTDPDTRKFNHSYERGEDYTTIHFEHNENVQKLTDSYSPMFIFRTVSVGEHDLSIEINAYNDKNEKTEYTVKYECDLYGQVVEYSQLPAVDESKIEIIRNTGLYLNELKNAADITKIFDDDIVIFEPGKGILEESEIIPNGAYIAALYEGYIADKIRICVANDVNCDAKITAADARLALRCAAKLENLQGVVKIAADMNNDNKITAADARFILRKAAKIDTVVDTEKEEHSTEIDKSTVYTTLKNEYVDKQEECKAHFSDSEYIKEIIVFSTLDGEIGFEFKLTEYGTENLDATVEFIKNSGFFSAVYYHKA